jgi:uncharacterized SAM-binding protein YcdF (DUF218 family)
MPRAAGLTRWRRRALVLATALLVVFVLVTARLFVWPAAGTPQAVDAVALFAGGTGERLALAQRLMAAGTAPHLVIPNGMAPEWPAGNRACTDDLPYEVHCPRPSPDTTRGEARAIADLAQEKGWRRVIAVTSSYQLSRARLLLGRCFDGQVIGMRAQPELSAPAWARRVGHEWLAWTRAMTLQRGC